MPHRRRTLFPFSASLHFPQRLCASTVHILFSRSFPSSEPSPSPSAWCSSLLYLPSPRRWCANFKKSSSLFLPLPYPLVPLLQSPPSFISYHFISTIRQRLQHPEHQQHQQTSSPSAAAKHHEQTNSPCCSRRLVSVFSSLSIISLPSACLFSQLTAFHPPATFSVNPPSFSLSLYLFPSLAEPHHIFHHLCPWLSGIERLSTPHLQLVSDHLVHRLVSTRQRVPTSPQSGTKMRAGFRAREQESVLQSKLIIQFSFEL